ncbi:MAG: methyltransferase domain-containing protein [Methylococcales bacterium]
MNKPIENITPHKSMTDIIRYYDHTQSDYGLLWLDKNNRAVHFGYYDENAKKHHDALANLNRVLADMAGIKENETVLDAGCGQGGSSVWLAENRGVKVIGITPVESQVIAANRFIDQKGLAGKVQVEIGNYTQTRFADNSFDVVWACESLCHADKKEEFYREAYRILKPGGRLIAAEYIRSEDSYHDEGDTLLTQWLHGWSINSIDSEEQHHSHAKQSGFEKITIRDVTENTEPSLRVLYRLSIILKPLGYFLRFFRIRSEYQHGNLIGSLRQYQALKKGFWFYGIISAQKSG